MKRIHSILIIALAIIWFLLVAVSAVAMSSVFSDDFKEAVIIQGFSKEEGRFYQLHYEYYD